MADQALRSTTDRSRARDWRLALEAEGIGARLTQEATGYTVWVAERDFEIAEDLLRAFDAENSAFAPPPATRERATLRGAGPFQGALVIVTSMVVFFAATGPPDGGASWFARGSADAARILAGEGWRVVTALSLHADWAHVLSNAVTGLFLLTALGRNVGAGVAFALSVVAGASGNLLNAALRSDPHISVGASTAVFGMVGILSGLSIVRRRERNESLRRVALPVVGALGVLAMIGTAGDRVDVWAHLFGLLVGIPIGVVTARALHQPLPAIGQILAGATTLGALLLSWHLALSVA